MKPAQAADLANREAATAIEAAALAKKQADSVREIAAALEPDPRTTIIGALASQEEQARLRVGPRRNRWQDLQRFEEQLVAVEQRRAAILAERGALDAELQSEPSRHNAALADWLTAPTGPKPVSRIPEFEQHSVDLRDEYEAQGIMYERLLRERAEHIAKNRKRFVSDMRKAIEKATARAYDAIDSLEAARQEVLDLRSTQVWASIFPHSSLVNEPNTQALAGATKRIQEPLFPGIKSGLIAESVFGLLRADVRFCAEVATLDQLAAEKGVSPAEFTGSDAAWQNVEPDLVGPRFPATWAGSPEAQSLASREKEYAAAMRRRLWGDR